MFKPIYDYEKTRAKYLSMLDHEGLNPTISALHREINDLENHQYDGGFEKDRLAVVQRLRDFSRELWTRQFAYQK